MRTRQGCVDVKHHGRDDFGVHHRRACIGDVVVAHADIAQRGGNECREEGVATRLLNLRRNSSKVETSNFAVGPNLEPLARVSNVNKQSPRAPLGPRGVNKSTIPVEWFAHADADGDGKVSGGEAVVFFSRAGLPQASLATLWQLVDNPPRGFLEKSQFDVAVQLIYVAQQGGEMNEMQANAIANGYASYPAPNMQGLSGAPAAPQQPQTMPGAGQISRMQTIGQNQQYQQQTPQLQPTQPQAQANGFGNFAGSFGDSFGDFGAQDAPVAAGDEPWPPVSHADVERYAQVFRHHDADGDGKLSGGEVVPMMMALNAPQEVLKDIWALADADGDGALANLQCAHAVAFVEAEPVVLVSSLMLRHAREQNFGAVSNVGSRRGRRQISIH